MNNCNVTKLPVLTVLLLFGFLSGCGQPHFATSTNNNKNNINKGYNSSHNQSNKYIISQLASVPSIKSVKPWPLPASIVAAAIPGKAPVNVCGLVITTVHYRIYTTLNDILLLQRLTPFMEFAWLNYVDMAGMAGGDNTAGKNSKLAIYLFVNRPQWESFTRLWAGRQSAEYLKIKSGAYYLNGACVAYNISRYANFSILAHEGWHQFSHVYFKYYLPAWLDEGIATNFEAYKWQNGKVVFDASRNGNRLKALQVALRTDRLIPLTKLLSMDAGMAISREGNKLNVVDADVYYAQVYALVRFLREYHYGMYRARFYNLLIDARLGKWKLPSVQLKHQAIIAPAKCGNPSRYWNTIIGPLVFKQYFNASASVFEAAYRAFCQSIVFNARLSSQ